MEEGVHFPKRRVGLSHLHSQAACVQPKNWYETYPAPIVSFPGACHGMPPPTPSSMIYSSHGVSSYLKGVFALRRKLRWLGFGLVGVLTLLANPLPRGDQRRKRGDVGFRGLGMGEPGHDAFQIDTDRNQNVLEMGFRQADVARPP